MGLRFEGLGFRLRLYGTGCRDYLAGQGQLVGGAIMRMTGVTMRIKGAISLLTQSPATRQIALALRASGSLDSRTLFLELERISYLTELQALNPKPAADVLNRQPQAVPKAAEYIPV